VKKKKFFFQFSEGLKPIRQPPIALNFTKFSSKVLIFSQVIP